MAPQRQDGSETIFTWNKSLLKKEAKHRSWVKIILLFPLFKCKTYIVSKSQLAT
jgi:hypothetical protein